MHSDVIADFVFPELGERRRCTLKEAARHARYRKVMGACRWHPMISSNIRVRVYPDGSARKEHSLDPPWWPAGGAPGARA
jgi:hypothetical protein